MPTQTPDIVDQKIDLLNRNEFVNNLLNVCTLLAQGRKNACFAINGEWGVGKTYVLNLFEEQIKGPYSEMAVLFHYNCWQYDYYEEPLTAIVAAILDELDSQVNLLSEDKREAVKSILKVIGAKLFVKISDKIEEKIGINPQEIKDAIESLNKEVKKEVTGHHEFDPYFDFKNTLQLLRSTIAELAEQKTVIFVVDELDRCLPEYAIKVLERLHHVFDEIPNVQVILSIDKEQLKKTVMHFYGMGVSVEKYLAKFIDFEIKLPTGEISNAIKELYPQYYSSFFNEITPAADVDAFCTMVLKGIDVRTCKAVIEKSQLSHCLLNDGVKRYDSSILCIELFLTLMKELGLNCTKAKSVFNINKLFTSSEIFSTTSQNIPGLVILSEKYKTKSGQNNPYLVAEHGCYYVFIHTIWGLILGCYRMILGFVDENWYQNPYSKIVVGDDDLRAYILKYWKFIKTIN